MEHCKNGVTGNTGNTSDSIINLSTSYLVGDKFLAELARDNGDKIYIGTDGNSIEVIIDFDTKYKDDLINYITKTIFLDAATTIPLAKNGETETQEVID